MRIKPGKGLTPEDPRRKGLKKEDLTEKTEENKQSSENEKKEKIKTKGRKKTAGKRTGRKREIAAISEFNKAALDLGTLLARFRQENGQKIGQVVDCLSEALRQGRKILIFGNGGSAAEAQHFAAELVNKFLRIRPALRAIALSTDTSILTSIGNDISFEEVFRRQIEALGDEDDVALALSTSGCSPNIIAALKAAREKKMITVALTGEGGGKLAPLSDYLLDVPSRSTPRIQEVHLFLLHLIAGELEERLG